MDLISDFQPQLHIDKKINIISNQDIILSGTQIFEDFIQSKNIHWFYKFGDKILKKQTICFFSHSQMSLHQFEKALYFLGVLCRLSTDISKFKKHNSNIQIIINIQHLLSKLYLSQITNSYFDEITQTISFFGGVHNINIIDSNYLKFYKKTLLSFKNSLIYQCKTQDELEKAVKNKNIHIALFYPDMMEYLNCIPPSTSKGFWGPISIKDMEILKKYHIQFIIPDSLSQIHHCDFDFSISK